MWRCLTMRFPIHCPGCVSWLKKMPGFPILGDQAIKPIFQRPTLESGSTPGLAYVESVECQKKGMVTHVVKSLINHPPVITCHHHFYRWYVYHSEMSGLWHCFTHITSNDQLLQFSVSGSDFLTMCKLVVGKTMLWIPGCNRLVPNGS